LKNGKPFAGLVPESERVCTGRDLAEAMDKAELSAEEAGAWHKDLAVARRRLTPSLAVADKYLKPDALVFPAAKPGTSQ